MEHAEAMQSESKTRGELQQGETRESEKREYHPQVLARLCDGDLQAYLCRCWCCSECREAEGGKAAGRIMRKRAQHKECAAKCENGEENSERVHRYGLPWLAVGSQGRPGQTRARYPTQVRVVLRRR